MKILAIETSCDETAISILEARGKFTNPKLEILSSVVASQVKLHAHWGGVVPNLAKREHGKNIIPVLKKALKNSKLPVFDGKILGQQEELQISKILEREPELLRQFLKSISSIKIPKIDAIAVTAGPGLEPALWVGINFAKALSLAWSKPIVAANHMEGHIVAALLTRKEKGSKRARHDEQKNKIEFPALALLVSGGHTELVLLSAKDSLSASGARPASGWKYKIIGQTRDDAVGEAFDKVARMLGLPYPGGPEISKLAEQWKMLGVEKDCEITLPRPMLNSGDFDFSFSGLKTAALYLINDLKKSKKKPVRKNSRDNRPKEGRFLGEATVGAVCAEFQQAAIDVLVSKTIKAAQKYTVKTVLLGGGVAANKELREQLKNAVKENLPDSLFLIPELKYTTDNAAMIAVAAYFHAIKKEFVKNPARLKADGNLSLK